MKIIEISEKQCSRLFKTRKTINEGVDWAKNDDGTINFSINQRMDNNSNKGKNSVDTRVFGTKDDILNGKIRKKNGEEKQKSKSLSQNYATRQSTIQFYQNVIKYIENGRQGEIENSDDVDESTLDAVNKWFERGDSDNKIIDACKKALNRITNDASQIFQTYNRVSAENDNDKVARYITGTVPLTNVKYISLFSMTDFNFSDAIKHGFIRQNGNTDSLLGIDKDSRQTDEYGNYKTIDITYDGGIKPNVAQNFSLNNVGQGHYKQQYGLNGGNEYNSVSQFLDKSIMYASYALKKEGFKPDVIVSAPSSSKFNNYYCTNLSHKLGVPYVDDFFKRNMINVKFDDGRDITAMRNEGFPEKEIFEFANQVKGIAYKEIAYFISEPVRNFINSNAKYFSSIPIEKSSRQKVPLEYVINCLTNHIYTISVNYMESDDTATKHLAKVFFSQNSKYKTKKYDYQYLLNQIKQRVSQKVINSIIQNVLQLTRQYVDLLKEKGYKLRFNTKRFKITQIKKQFRPFLHNIYVIADKYINENGELFKRYKNAKFVIFDEDINSGATLKLVIDALKENLPDSTDNNILCLVNAYSGSGY